MLKFVKFILLVFTAQLIGCGEPPIVEGEVVRYGAFAPVENKSLGRIEPKQIELLEKGYTIENAMGKTFGFEYMLDNRSPNRDITVEEAVIFPGKGITDPKLGYPIKVQTELYQFKNGQNQVFLFTIDESWKHLKGEWFFQVKYNNEIAIQEAFTIE